MLEQWSVFVNAGIPVTWLCTHEEARAEAALAATAARMQMSRDGVTNQGNLAIWSLTSGEQSQPGWEQAQGWPVDHPLPTDWSPDVRLAASPHGALLQAITWCEEHKGSPMVMIIRDAHTFTKSPQWRRAVKDGTRRLRSTQGRLVLLSHLSEVPVDMRNDVPLLLPGLPSHDALLRQCGDTLVGLDVEANVEACADALRGLGLREAKDAMLVDFVSHDGVDAKRLADFKAQELTKVPGITFRGRVESIDEVGGLEVLIEDLTDFQGALTRAAEDFGCDRPKGYMVCGVPGCGKSLFGRAASNLLGLPLVEFSPSECEGGLVGETGDKVRVVLRTIDSVSPCVVLIDEGEKGFGSGGERDSGSKETLRGEFLKWSQGRESRVFVVMTCNDAGKLPPEMKRLGRWDDTYFVDLPHEAERAAIIKVHLKKRRREFEQEAIDKLAVLSKDFSGAELEVGISRAIRRCFKEGQRELVAADVLAQYERITPQSRGEQIKSLRKWAKEVNATLASKPAPRSQAPKKGRKGAGSEPGKPTRLVN